MASERVNRWLRDISLAPFSDIWRREYLFVTAFRPIGNIAHSSYIFVSAILKAECFYDGSKAQKQWQPYQPNTCSVIQSFELILLSFAFCPHPYLSHSPYSYFICSTSLLLEGGQSLILQLFYYENVHGAFVFV